MHQIKIESINRFSEIEWTEVITAGSKSAARRKANRVILDTGVDNIKVAKHTNQYDDSIETWRLI